MWKCPKCETINDADTCTVCGEKQPVYSSNNQMPVYNNQTPVYDSEKTVAFGAAPVMPQWSANSQRPVMPTAPVKFAESRAKGSKKSRTVIFSLIAAILVVAILIVAVLVGVILKVWKQDTSSETDSTKKAAKVTKEYEDPVAAEEHKDVASDVKSDDDTYKYNEPHITVERAVLNGKAASSDGIEYNTVQLTNVQDYITNTIQPLYYDIKREELESDETHDGKVIYYDYSGDICWLQYPAGFGGNKYERQYYFDRNNGELIFAFIFLGTTEQRLYFYKNSIIRYIDANGNSFDNPTEREILYLSEDAINEAYRK